MPSYVLHLQSFFAGLAFSGALTSGLRLVTKAVFDKSDDGLRKGARKSPSVRDFLPCHLLYAEQECLDLETGA